MVTAPVAALGLLVAALSTGVGSDSQRPFALVIDGPPVNASISGCSSPSY
jgi:Cu/Ag efflux pump CusA